jgi:hypothetical protein
MPMIPPVATSRIVARSSLVRRRSRPGSIPPCRSRRRASRSRWRASREARCGSGSVKDRSPAAGGSLDLEEAMPRGYPDCAAKTSVRATASLSHRGTVVAVEARFGRRPHTSRSRTAPLARCRFAGSAVYCALGTGVNVSSSARSWKLRSSSSGDAEAAPHGCRTIRTTWRMPPHRQRAAEDQLAVAGPSL